MELRKNAKQDFNVAETTFDVKTARDLVNGNYWQEENQDEQNGALNETDYFAKVKEPR